MSAISVAAAEGTFIGLVFEGFFCGIYSAIFSMYLHYQVSRKSADNNNRPTILFYSFCILYVLSVAHLALDISAQFTPNSAYYGTYMSTAILIACCDFIGQSILIYRCWIVWDNDIRVVIIPSILAFIFLILWVAGFGPSSFDPSIQQVVTPNWANLLTVISIAMSLSVNAVVTGLIVFKIFKVYREVKPLHDQTIGTTGGSKLRSIIFIILESGMALFAIQLAWLMVSIFPTQTAAQPVLYVYKMINGLTPTIIQVRVSMGLSFHDNESLVEATSGLRFGSHVNSATETDDDDDIGIDHQEDEDDYIGVRRSSCDIVEVQTGVHVSRP